MATKFNVVKVNDKIIKAIGKEKNILGISNNKETVIFLKNDYDNFETKEENILKRLYNNKELANELSKFKDDIYITLQNINSLSSLNSKLPKISDKELTNLVELSFAFKDKNQTKHLSKISETQHKMYKILEKIQEDLIDEQDTTLKSENQITKAKSISQSQLTTDADFEDDEYTDSDFSINSKSKIKGGVVRRKSKVRRAKVKVSNALKTIGRSIKIAGKVLLVADFILLLTNIVEYWQVAEESIDEPGCIEKLIFAVIGGITEWLQSNANLVSWVVDSYVELNNYIANSIKSYAPLLGNLEPFANSLSSMFKYLPGNLIAEYLVKPVIVWTKSNSAFGAPAGVYAVKFYREIKDTFVLNIPNESTFKFLFGTDEDFERVQTDGIYNWNALGNSGIKGNSQDLAKLMTMPELKKIQEHNDLDTYDREKVKKALEIKESQGITDEEVKALRNSNTDLVRIHDDVVKNTTSFGGVHKWKSLWADLAKYSQQIVKTNPESTVITYFEDENGKPGTLNSKHLLYTNSEGLMFVDNSIDAPKELCGSILRLIGRKLVRAKETFYFTPFGTVIIQQVGVSIEETKMLQNMNIVKNFKTGKNGTLVYVNYVLGYFDTKFNFHKNQYYPNDIAFKEIFKNNIITESDVDYTKNIAKPPAGAVDSVKPETSKVSVDNSANGVAEQQNIATPSTSIFNNSSYSLPPVMSSEPPKISGSEIKKAVWDFFKTNYNLTDEQIAGIMGNLHVESGFLPKYVQNYQHDVNGPSGGLCQWHDVTGRGGRLTKLMNFANKQGKDWRDIHTQLEYLKTELDGGYRNVISDIRKCDNVHDSSYVWLKKFEVPADRDYNGKNHNNRTKNGFEYLKLYGGNKNSEVKNNHEKSDIPQLEQSSVITQQTQQNNYTNSQIVQNTTNITNGQTVEIAQQNYNTNVVHNDVISNQVKSQENTKVIVLNQIQKLQEREQKEYEGITEELFKIPLKLTIEG